MPNLSLRERRLLYRIGRQKFIECGRDRDRTVELTRAELTALGIPPIVIEIMVRLLVHFIIEWMKDDKEPAEVCVVLQDFADEGEPEDDELP